MIFRLSVSRFSTSLIKSHHVCAAFMFLCALVANGNSQRINKTTEGDLLSRIMDSRIIFSEMRHKGENLVPRQLAQGMKAPRRIASSESTKLSISIWKRSDCNPAKREMPEQLPDYWS